MSRLGSAIATTILSYAAVSLVGVDQAQAALLTYDFTIDNSVGSGFFKVSNSSLTGIDFEIIAVSEGRLNRYVDGFGTRYPLKRKDYYNLAGAIALFYQGNFRGLGTSGGETVITEINVSPDEPYGPYYVKYEGRTYWNISTNENISSNGPFSFFSEYNEVLISDRNRLWLIDRAVGRVNYAPVSYTLVNTEPEPVPEPITAGGTALALAGLSWLKHKKKMAA